MVSKVAVLLSLLNDITVDDIGDDEATRINVIAAAEKLAYRLQSGIERGIDLTHQRSTVFPTLDVFSDLGLWDAWATLGGEISLEGLAKLSNTPVDLNLLRK